MTTNSRILLFDAAPEDTQRLEDQLRGRGFELARAAVEDAARSERDLTGDLAVVVAGAADRTTAVQRLLGRLCGQHTATLVWGLPAPPDEELSPLVEWLSPGVTLDEVVAKVGTLAHYAPLVRGFERELEHIHRLGEQLNHYFNEIDQEMRLAGRLQRDFLPRQLVDLPPYTFQVLYRPASWVSGDMYDVFRIDEYHVGMFVADAMGHGVAAGLLTMFLRQALVSKRVAGNSYSIITPAEALHSLHQCLIRQKLPNCQFVTAAYAIVDTRNGDLHLARAGHPYPLVVRAGGDIAEVRVEGSLLGLADLPAEFQETQLVLNPGDKVVFYTDGMEDVVLKPRCEAEDESVFTEQLRAWACRPAAAFVAAVQDHLDCREGSLHPPDDVTLLMMEVGGLR